MTPLEPIAGQLIWGGHNFANNLDFIPDAKLNWKPAPTASSALEIAQHAAAVTRSMQAMMSGEGDSQSLMQNEPMPQTRDEAKAAIMDATANLAAYLRTLKAEDLGRIIHTGFMGDMPLGQFAVIPATDFIHHHGQIAYIQTLLGDTESHFATM